jgi:large subunit ribosomal protein L3
MKFILGTKLNMTQVWEGDEHVSITCVQAGPCFVTQIKQKETDGYNAIQVGYGERKDKNINKPQKGHLKKANIKINDKKTLRYSKEFRTDENNDINLSDMIDVSTFEKGDKIQVTSTSKGKGFQGVVKRHGFSGSKKTHGNKDQLRMPGSIGATGPAHVFKGMKMGGRMGGDRVTLKNLEIIDVDIENNVLSIKGAIPGAISGLVQILGKGDLKITKGEVKKEEKKEEEKKEEIKSEKIEEKVENKEDKKIEGKKNEK